MEMDLDLPGRTEVSRRRRRALHAATLLIALCGFACLTITRRSLPGTFDESNHLAATSTCWPTAIRPRCCWTRTSTGARTFSSCAARRARGVDRLKIAYFGTLRQCRHDLPPLEPLVPGRPTSGWIAISESYYRHRSTFMLLKDPCDPTSAYKENEAPPQPFAWLHGYRPVAIAGTSIRLYDLRSSRSP